MPRSIEEKESLLIETMDSFETDESRFVVDDQPNYALAPEHPDVLGLADLPFKNLAV